MTIQTIKFNATDIDNPEVTTRLFNSEFVVEDLEHHPEVTIGACITGIMFDPNTQQRMLGLWNVDGINVTGGNPNLIQERDVVLPEMRRCYINLYRSTETAHGFTVGSKTGEYEDMKARGLRNSTGNYLGTVPISIDLNNVESFNDAIDTMHEERDNAAANAAGDVAFANQQASNF